MPLLSQIINEVNSLKEGIEKLNNFKKACLITLAFAALSAPGKSLAVIDPPGGSTGYDPGVIDQKNLMQLKEYEQKIRQEDKHVDKNDIIMEKKVYDEIEKLPNKEVRFILNSVQFKGNTVLTEDQLLAIVCDSIETEVSIDDLIKFANLITERYHELGYISSLAYVPPQRIEDGNIEIIIIEGKYGSVDLVGNKWARSKYVTAQFLTDKHIVSENILNIKDVQTSLQELNSQGYMKGSITLQDNEESAEYTDVVYEVKDRFPLDLDLRFDNQGRSNVGLNRFVIFGGMYNLTGFGDQLVSTTTIARKSIGQGIFYSIPIAKNETKFNVGYSYSGTNIGNFGAVRDIQGKSHNFFTGFSRRLVKTENFKMYGDVSLDMRNTETTANLGTGRREVIGFPYKTRAVRVNTSSIKDDFYGKWFTNVGASFGVPWFDASNDWEDWKELPANKFIKVNANLARVQVLPLRSLGIFQLNSQWASRNLWYSEKMQIGGISSVRGYEEAFGLGDYGVSASLELRTPVPFLRNILSERLKFIDDSIRIAGFYDVGWFGDRYSDMDATYMMSVGGGLVLKLTKYLSGNVYLGVPIGKKYDAGSNCRVHFTVTSNIL